MKNFVGILMLVIIVNGCMTNKNNKNFETYINKMPEFTLPYKFNNETKYETIDNKRFSEYEIDKYNLNLNQVIGKITLGNKSYGVLYSFPADWSIPIMITYDKTGEKIDSLAIDAGYSDEEESYYFNKTATINKNLIIEIESFETLYQLDENEKRVDSTARKKEVKNIFLIEENGKIKKQ